MNRRERNGPLRSFALVLRVPGLLPLIVALFVGRLPLGMISISLLLGVNDQYGTLGTAGLVAAATTLGTGLGAPAQGWLLDRYAKRLVIAIYTGIHAVTLVSLATGLAQRRSGTMLAILALAAGLSIPSLSACSRLTLRLAAPKPVLGAAFALDAALIEVIFIAGPALAASLTAWASAVASLGLCAGAVVLGSASYLLLCPQAWLRPPSNDQVTSASDQANQANHADPSDQNGRASASAPGARSRAWVVLAAFVTSMGLVAVPLGLIDSGVAALSEEEGSVALAGPPLSAMAAGSVIGGVVLGALAQRVALERRYLALTTCYCLLLASLATKPGYLALTAILAVAGLCIAPMISVGFLILDRLSPPEVWMRSQSWGTAANTIGAAAGVAVGSHAAQSWGSSGALLLAAPMVLASVLVALPTLRALAHAR